MVKNMKDKIKEILVLAVTALICSSVLYIVMKGVGEI